MQANLQFEHLHRASAPITRGGGRGARSRITQTPRTPRIYQRCLLPIRRVRHDTSVRDYERRSRLHSRRTFRSSSGINLQTATRESSAIESLRQAIQSDAIYGREHSIHRRIASVEKKNIPDGSPPRFAPMRSISQARSDRRHSGAPFHISPIVDSARRSAEILPSRGPTSRCRYILRADVHIASGNAQYGPSPSTAFPKRWQKLLESAPRRKHSKRPGALFTNALLHCLRMQ